MKAIKMRIQKISRPGVILLATVVAIITSMVAANATQSLTTPNAAFVSYNLAPSAKSAPITPATNRSVLVMGCCTTSPYQGGGQVSLLHFPSFAIEWFGLETTTSATITSGFGGTAGTHIVWLDTQHVVDIQTASADTILIHNPSVSATVAGNVTLIW
jgi:hypothetical protein